MKVFFALLLSISSFLSYAQLANTDPLMLNIRTLTRTLPNSNFEKETQNTNTTKAKIVKNSSEKENIVHVEREKYPKEKPKKADEIFLTVQIAASKKVFEESFFENTPIFFEKGKDGYYRYYSNKFQTISKARSYAKKLRETTKFKESFVTKLRNGEKVSIK